MSIIRILPKNTQGAYAIRPYSLPADGFRIHFATSFSKTRRVSLRLVAKSKTRRVLRHVVWQSPKPAGFYAMSCGRVQNPPGFTLCRVAKSKTCRVLRYVVWQSPKPAGFYAMSCGGIQNPAGLVLCRVAESKTRRVLRHVVWQNPKPAGFRAMSCGRVQNSPGFTLCRVAESKTRRVSCYVVWRNPKPAGFWGLAMIFFSSLDGRKGPCRGREVFPGTFLRPIMYPANFLGLGEALIFFCFFSSIKGRKEDPEGKKKRPFSVSIIRFLPKTSKERIGYAPTRVHVGNFWFLDNYRTQILASYRKARFGFIPSDILKRVPVGQTNRQ